jgi:hypothetical protein
VILALLWVLTKDVEVADVFDFVLFKWEDALLLVSMVYLAVVVVYCVVVLSCCDLKLPSFKSEMISSKSRDSCEILSGLVVVVFYFIFEVKYIP